MPISSDLAGGLLRLVGPLARALGRRGGAVATAVALVVANLVVLGNALVHGWPIADLLLVYWLESAIIGVFNMLRMATARTEIAPWVKLLSIPFFAVHYGGFMAVHLIFLIVIASRSPWVDPFTEAPKVLGALLSTSGMRMSIAALVASHAFSFVVNHLRRERFHVSAEALFIRPYGRIIAMHVAVLFGFGATMIGGLGPRLGALVVALLKLPFDVYLHLRERKKTDA